MTTITIYDGNTLQLKSTMNVDSISGYTGTFYIKKYRSDNEYTEQITGTTEGNSVTFIFTPSETDMKPGKYIYEIRITNGTNVFTTNQGDLIVLDSIATHTSD